MNSKESQDDVPYMVQEKVLRLIGVWPVETETFFSIARWYISMAIQISTICSLSLEVRRHCLDTDDTMDALMMDLSSVVSLSKLFLLRFNMRHTRVIVDSFYQDWSVSQDPRHRRIMTKYFERGRLVSLVMLYLGYASGASFVIKAFPLYVSSYFQTFKADTNEKPDNESSKPVYFLATSCVFGTSAMIVHWIILILQAAEIFVNAVAHCGNDGFFFSLVMYLCGQFEILAMRFAELKFEEFDFRKKFALLIRRHCHLTSLADSLEQAFNMIILVQVLMSMLLLCVGGFQLLISLHDNEKVAAVKHIVLIVTMLVQFFLYAYAGESLELRTENIAFSIYDSAWYDFRAPTLKDLSFVISRGSNPHQLTAGKFLSMNLFTFKEVLKASGSYLSVLRVMIDA